MAGELRRLQILRVAVRLFSQRGFRGTTTKEIAQAAGVSEAMVFRHFATKEELYAANPRAIPAHLWYSTDPYIDEKVRKLFDERGDPSAQALPIVIYCSGGDCEDSHMLAQKLWGIQFNNVYVYKDGFPDWQQHGAPVHTGANP